MRRCCVDRLKAQFSAKALLLFAALAGVMYATRRIDWRAPRGSPAA